MKFYSCYVKVFFKSVRNILIGFIGILIIYLLSALILSLISVNSDFRESKENTYFIYLVSNGVHIDLILPAYDSVTNWKETIPFEDKITPYVNYIGFGWGNKEFYMNAPKWSDLNARITMNALFLKGGSALHVTPYHSIIEHENIIRINMSKKEYINLNQYIRESFITNKMDAFIPIEGLNYGDHDIFFEAKRKYHLFNTCNTWTNRGLKKSGLKACLWTPFDKGILYQYRKFNINSKQKKSSCK